MVSRSITGRRQEVSGAGGEEEEGMRQEGVGGGQGVRLCLQFLRRAAKAFTSA